MKKIMLGTDLESYKKYKNVYLRQTRFLDGTELKKNKVCYQSYPRSGNTFLRKYLELITGIATGSDMNVHSIKPLQFAGLIGEGTVDDTVWIIKSHHPHRFRSNPDFYCSKIIVCVRNPFEVIISWAHFHITETHS